MPRRRSSVVFLGDAAANSGGAPASGSTMKREDIEKAHHRKSMVGSAALGASASGRRASMTGVISSPAAAVVPGTVQRRSSAVASNYAGISPEHAAPDRLNLDFSAPKSTLGKKAVFTDAKANLEARQEFQKARREMHTNKAHNATSPIDSKSSGGTTNEEKSTSVRGGVHDHVNANSTRQRRGSAFTGIAATKDVHLRGSLAINSADMMPDAFAEKVKEQQDAAIVLYNEHKAKEMVKFKEMEKEIDPHSSRKHGFMCRFRGGHALGVYCVDWTADCEYIVSGSHDGVVIQWSLLEHREKTRYVGHSASVFTIAFNPISRFNSTQSRVLTASQDGTVRVWARNSGKMQHLLRPHGTSPIYCASWCNDGSLIASCGDFRGIVVYNLEALDVRLREGDYHPDSLDHPSDIKGFSRLFRIEPAPANPQGHTAAVRKVVWSNTDELLISCGDDCLVKVWSVVNSGDHVMDLKGHKRPVHDVSCHPSNPNVILSAGADGTVRLWSLRSGVNTHTFTPHSNVVYSARFLFPDFERIVSVSHDMRILVLSARTGKPVQRIESGHESWILSVAPRRDGLGFCTGSGDASVAVWRAMPLSAGERALQSTEAAVHAQVEDCRLVCVEMFGAAARGKKNERYKVHPMTGQIGARAAAGTAPAEWNGSAAAKAAANTAKLRKEQPNGTQQAILSGAGGKISINEAASQANSGRRASVSVPRRQSMAGAAGDLDMNLMSLGYTHAAPTSASNSNSAAQGLAKPVRRASYLGTGMTMGTAADRGFGAAEEIDQLDDTVDRGLTRSGSSANVAALGKEKTQVGRRSSFAAASAAISLAANR